MSPKQILIIISLIAFFLYHPNSSNGPDSKVYLAVAHSILTTGSLNILPETPLTGNRIQVTRTAHAPIHQNIGGVLFVLPVAALARVTQYMAGLLPGAPPAFRDLGYHEALWCGIGAYLLAFLSLCCLYRVARVYHENFAVIAALTASTFGGPLLMYVTTFPCQTNLPTLFLSSLLLYVFHFADRSKYRSWFLLGAIWSLGVFVRLEMAVWGVLLLYAIIQERRQASWRQLLMQIGFLAGGGLLFCLPVVMLRQVLFGVQGSTYGIQFDMAILLKSNLMLWGPRNGLFSFWPILFVALAGYFFRLRSNPAVYHVLLIILLAGTVICGSNLFWSGGMGDPFHQRRFFFLIPCFILYLARLFDQFRSQRVLLIIVSAVCAGWALLLYSAYGTLWEFAGGVRGFLMPNDFSTILKLLHNYCPLFLKQLAVLVFLPKHGYAIALVPLMGLLLSLAYSVYSRVNRQQGGNYGIACLVTIACVTTLFLSGAASRGRSVFNEFTRNNPQFIFVARDYEIDVEIMGSMADCVAFFYEQGDTSGGDHFKEKTLAFLQREAPERVKDFETICAALKLRHQLGWQRLEPEQNLPELLQWYNAAQAAIRNGSPVPDPRSRFLL